MTALLIFAIALLVAVLLSKLADRSVLSMAVLFLAAGFLCGPGMLELITLEPQEPVVQRLAELALFSILFTDGMRLNLRELTSNWRLPGRALLVGLPLTLLGTAVLAHYVAGLSWLEALLVGAIRARPIPSSRRRSSAGATSRRGCGIFSTSRAASTTVSRSRSSSRSWHSSPTPRCTPRSSPASWRSASRWARRCRGPGCRLEAEPLLRGGQTPQPLFAFSLGLLVLALALLTHANLYLAAFAAGITVATVRSDLRDEFHQFGEIVAELLKLAALLVFGVLMSPNFLAEVPLSGYLFAALALLVVRPIAIALSLVRSRLGWRERITAGWFGPKGFASVIYGLLIVQAAVPGAGRMFHLVGVVVAGSIVEHSSTDVLFARWFRRTEGDLKLQQ